MQWHKDLPHTQTHAHTHTHSPTCSSTLGQPLLCLSFYMQAALSFLAGSFVHPVGVSKSLWTAGRELKCCSSVGNSSALMVEPFTGSNSNELLCINQNAHDYISLLCCREFGTCQICIQSILINKCEIILVYLMRLCSVKDILGFWFLRSFQGVMITPNSLEHGKMAMSLWPRNMSSQTVRF